MLKYIALLFNTVALLIYQFFFADGITITQNVPSSAKAESEFTVELTVNKGATGGFAKLQQDLPEGFTAEKIESNGGTFTFSNQAVKFIWMSLPSDKEFKISYKIKVAAGIVGGDKIIAGKFSYVVDNVKQSIDIAPATIKIEGGASAPVVTNTPPPVTTPEPTPTPTPTVTPTPVETPTPTPVADVTPTPTPTPTVTPTPVADVTPTPTPTTEPSSITCVRNVPSTAGNEFTVEVTVNKGNASGFAKFLETLPAGFTATAGESQGASFSFTDQKVKYVWVSMPSKPEFKISYKVTVDAGVTGNQVIDGVFSFIENDETKKFTLTPSTVNIGGSGTTPPVVNNTPPVTTPTTTTTPTVTNTPEPTIAKKTPVVPEKPISASTIPSPQGNVNYRVQIMALHRAVEASTLAARYNINENVKTEMAEGFTKYTVGSHNEYKNARDAREEIKNKGVVGPFVTAYNSGKRITVQEALMISNQKWYR